MIRSTGSSGNQYWSTSGRPPFAKRVLSVLVLVTFIVSSHFHGTLYAQTVNHSEPAAAAGNFPSDLSQIRVPETMGKVEEFFNGPSSRAVVLVQDAHAIPDAQQSIAALISFFQKQYGIDCVALEGAASELDSEMFRTFPDKKILKSVLKAYSDQGNLAGGVAAAIFSGKTGSSGENKTVFHGIEDWDLYQDGIGDYLAAMKNQKLIGDRLSVIGENLKKEKAENYSEQLLAMDRALESFASNAANLLEVLKKLAQVKAPAAGSELALLLEQSMAQSPQTGSGISDRGSLMSGENKSQEDVQSPTAKQDHPKSNIQDPSSTSTEVQQIARQVRRYLEQPQGLSHQGTVPSPEALKAKLSAFNEKFQDYQTSRITPEAFALFMKGLVREYRLPIKVSESLGQRMSKQKRMEDIQGTKLFDDFERYAEEVKASLFENDIQRGLNRRSRELALLERFNKLELTQSDWEEIRGSGIVNRVSEKKQELATMMASLKTDFSAHVSFYENAVKRDRALFDGISHLLKFQSSDSGFAVASFETRPPRPDPRAVLAVAGGFHARGLTKLLRENGISYVLLMPAIREIPEETSYRDQMRGNVPWKDYFEVRDGKVNLYEAFVRGTRDRLLGKTGMSDEGRGLSEQNNGIKQDEYSSLSTHASVLKFWRDEILRDLASQNRLADAGQYTRFIDEATPKGREIETHRKKLMEKVDRFISGLRGLQADNRLSEPNILKLLKTTAAQTQIGAVASPKAEMRADLVRGEMRTSSSFGAEMLTSGRNAGVRYYAAHPTPEMVQLTDHPGETITLSHWEIARDLEEDRLGVGSGSGAVTLIEPMVHYARHVREARDAMVDQFRRDNEADPKRMSAGVLKVAGFHSDNWKTYQYEIQIVDGEPLIVNGEIQIVPRLAFDGSPSVPLSEAESDLQDGILIYVNGELVLIGKTPDEYRAHIQNRREATPSVSPPEFEERQQIKSAISLMDRYLKEYPPVQAHFNYSAMPVPEWAEGYPLGTISAAIVLLMLLDSEAVSFDVKDDGNITNFDADYGDSEVYEMVLRLIPLTGATLLVRAARSNLEGAETVTTLINIFVEAAARAMVAAEIDPLDFDANFVSDSQTLDANIRNLSQLLSLPEDADLLRNDQILRPVVQRAIELSRLPYDFAAIQSRDAIRIVRQEGQPIDDFKVVRAALAKRSSLVLEGLSADSAGGPTSVSFNLQSVIADQLVMPIQRLTLIPGEDFGQWRVQVTLLDYRGVESSESVQTAEIPQDQVRNILRLLVRRLQQLPEQHSAKTLLPAITRALETAAAVSPAPAAEVPAVSAEAPDYPALYRTVTANERFLANPPPTVPAAALDAMRKTNEKNIAILAAHDPNWRQTFGAAGQATGERKELRGEEQEPIRMPQVVRFDSAVTGLAKARGIYTSFAAEFEAGAVQEMLQDVLTAAGQAGLLPENEPGREAVMAAVFNALKDPKNLIKLSGWFLLTYEHERNWDAYQEGLNQLRALLLTPAEAELNFNVPGFETEAVLRFLFEELRKLSPSGMAEKWAEFSKQIDQTLRQREASLQPAARTWWTDSFVPSGKPLGLRFLKAGIVLAGLASAVIGAVFFHPWILGLILPVLGFVAADYGLFRWRQSHQQSPLNARLSMTQSLNTLAQTAFDADYLQMDKPAAVAVMAQREVAETEAEEPKITARPLRLPFISHGLAVWLAQSVTALAAVLMAGWFVGFTDFMQNTLNQPPAPEPRIESDIRDRDALPLYSDGANIPVLINIRSAYQGWRVRYSAGDGTTVTGKLWDVYPVKSEMTSYKPGQPFTMVFVFRMPDGSERMLMRLYDPENPEEFRDWFELAQSTVPIFGTQRRRELRAWDPAVIKVTPVVSRPMRMTADVEKAAAKAIARGYGVFGDPKDKPEEEEVFPANLNRGVVLEALNGISAVVNGDQAGPAAGTAIGGLLLSMIEQAKTKSIGNKNSEIQNLQSSRQLAGETNPWGIKTGPIRILADLAGRSNDESRDQEIPSYLLEIFLRILFDVMRDQDRSEAWDAFAVRIKTAILQQCLALQTELDTVSSARSGTARFLTAFGGGKKEAAAAARIRAVLYANQLMLTALDITNMTRGDLDQSTADAVIRGLQGDVQVIRLSGWKSSPDFIPAARNAIREILFGIAAQQAVAGAAADGGRNPLAAAAIGLAEDLRTDNPSPLADSELAARLAGIVVNAEQIVADDPVDTPAKQILSGYASQAARILGLNNPQWRQQAAVEVSSAVAASAVVELPKAAAPAVSASTPLPVTASEAPVPSQAVEPKQPPPAPALVAAAAVPTPPAPVALPAAEAAKPVRRPVTAGTVAVLSPELFSQILFRNGFGVTSDAKAKRAREILANQKISIALILPFLAAFADALTKAGLETNLAGSTASNLKSNQPQNAVVTNWDSYVTLRDRNQRTYQWQVYHGGSIGRIADALDRPQQAGELKPIDGADLEIYLRTLTQNIYEAAGDGWARVQQSLTEVLQGAQAAETSRIEAELGRLGLFGSGEKKKQLKADQEASVRIARLALANLEVVTALNRREMRTTQRILDGLVRGHKLQLNNAYSFDQLETDIDATIDDWLSWRDAAEPANKAAAVSSFEDAIHRLIEKAFVHAATVQEAWAAMQPDFEPPADSFGYRVARGLGSLLDLREGVIAQLKPSQLDRVRFFQMAGDEGTVDLTPMGWLVLLTKKELRLLVGLIRNNYDHINSSSPLSEFLTRDELTAYLASLRSRAPQWDDVAAQLTSTVAKKTGSLVIANPHTPEGREALRHVSAQNQDWSTAAEGIIAHLARYTETYRPVTVSEGEDIEIGWREDSKQLAVSLKVEYPVGDQPIVKLGGVEIELEEAPLTDDDGNMVAGSNALTGRYRLKGDRAFIGEKDTPYSRALIYFLSHSVKTLDVRFEPKQIGYRTRIPADPNGPFTVYNRESDDFWTAPTGPNDLWVQLQDADPSDSGYWSFLDRSFDFAQLARAVLVASELEVLPPEISRDRFFEDPQTSNFLPPQATARLLKREEMRAEEPHRAELRKIEAVQLGEQAGTLLVEYLNRPEDAAAEQMAKLTWQGTANQFEVFIEAFRKAAEKKSTEVRETEAAATGLTDEDYRLAMPVILERFKAIHQALLAELKDQGQLLSIEIPEMANTMESKQFAEVFKQAFQELGAKNIDSFIPYAPGRARPDERLLGAVREMGLPMSETVRQTRAFDRISRTNDHKAVVLALTGTELKGKSEAVIPVGADSTGFETPRFEDLVIKFEMQIIIGLTAVTVLTPEEISTLNQIRDIQSRNETLPATLKKQLETISQKLNAALLKQTTVLGLENAEQMLSFSNGIPSFVMKAIAAIVTNACAEARTKVAA